MATISNTPTTACKTRPAAAAAPVKGEKVQVCLLDILGKNNYNKAELPAAGPGAAEGDHEQVAGSDKQPAARQDPGLGQGGTIASCYMAHT